jgi:hypothetical protein
MCVCVCVCSLSYPLRKAHAPYYIVTSGQTVCTIVFCSISSMAPFLEKMLLNIKYVFWISLHFLSETFLTLRRNERDLIKNVYYSLCKELEFSRQILETYSNIKFHQIPSSGRRVVPYGRTDG